MLLVHSFKFSHSGRCQFDRIPFDLIKGFAFGQDRPGGARQLVGQRGDHDAVRPSGEQRGDPTRSL